MCDAEPPQQATHNLRVLRKHGKSIGNAQSFQQIYVFPKTENTTLAFKSRTFDRLLR